MSEGVTGALSSSASGARRGLAGFIDALQGAFGNGRPRWRRVAATAIVVTLLAFVWLLSLPAVRVGDGMEYYAMFYAWRDGLRPWMTPETFQSYEALYDSGQIAGMLPADVLQQAFPALRLGDTADFNHFWFYSLLAAIVSRVLGVVGIDLGPHASFMLLHSVILGATVAVCGAMHGWRGIAVVLVIVFASPLIWFVNKVHVEFFSVCLTLSSFAFLTRGRLVFAALTMAAAGTQNPGLLLPALVMLGMRVVTEREKTYTLIEVAAVVATVGLMAIHPFYYLARYDTITTQLLAGGAKPGVALNVFYIWLVDPDLGLFPNWILGFFFLVFGACEWRRRASARTISGAIKNNTVVLIGMAVFVVASIYSHSSTVNLNSGGSPGIARYALWYIALLYPMILLSIDAFSRSRVASGALIAAAIGSAAIVSVRDGPAMGENATTPSVVSFAVQRFVPFLYAPPPEVFRERYGAMGETPGHSAVVGPDCQRVLIIGRAAPERGNMIFVPGRCSFRPPQIQKWVEANRSDASVYRRLTNADLQAPHKIKLSEDIAISSGQADTVYMLAEGWSTPEPWGVWSEGRKSVVVVQVPDESRQELSLSMVVNGFTPPASPTREIAISVNGGKPIDFRIDQDQPQKIFQLPIVNYIAAQPNVVRIEFFIKNPISPSEAGLSGDGRQLGIGLVSIRVEPAGTP